MSIFVIQAGSPRLTEGPLELYDESLGDAIEACFKLESEQAILNWNAFYTPLCYKYQFSEIISEILDMIERLRDRRNGAYEAIWRSSDFHGSWLLEWRGDKLELLEKQMMDSSRDAKKHPDLVVLPKSDFVAEWKRPLGNIINALIYFNLQNIQQFDRLVSVYSGIPQEGYYYT